MRRKHDTAKRVVELIITPVLLFGMLPLLALVTILVFFAMGRPILYRGERVGKGERLFNQLKFRTMLNHYGPDGELLPDAQRLKRFGRFLRKTSLDELPQLLNILKGEMSFIGPRPLFASYLPRYSALQRRRHEVRPGITGLAQVRGRNDLDWDLRFASDVEYVVHASFRLDFFIFIRTVMTVLKARGVTAQVVPSNSRYIGTEEFLGRATGESELHDKPIAVAS